MDVVLIGGLSGSGKSVALGALEDAGYDAIGNLPVALVVPVVEHLAGIGAVRVAIALDARREVGLSGLGPAIDTLKGAGRSVRLVYLDARDETLVKRFSETRRRHPFSGEDTTLSEAIARERALLADARALGIVFDTSELPAGALRTWIKDFVSVAASPLALQFESFGFKHGVPLDADLVFDVRCLPNPHYEPRLAPQTGRDAEVVAFLEAQPEVERMFADIHHFVASWLPDYARDNRNYLTVAIGCTGGRHRSVYLVERLARAFGGRYPVLRRHRELA
ncbi:MAG: RNase adapter RapZ [Burkholderiales bacterium]|nr:RNase adapter RapZ [Burkholderiales bacterium]MCC7112970.1 RNase adapter RapZ [Burkholderiales bacterium]